MPEAIQWSWQVHGPLGLLAISGWVIAWILWKRLGTITDLYVGQSKDVTAVVTRTNAAMEDAADASRLHTEALRVMTAENKGLRKLIDQVRRPS